MVNLFFFSLLALSLLLNFVLVCFFIFFFFLKWITTEYSQFQKYHYYTYTTHNRIVWMQFKWNHRVKVPHSKSKKTNSNTWLYERTRDRPKRNEESILKVFLKKKNIPAKARCLADKVIELEAENLIIEICKLSFYTPKTFCAIFCVCFNGWAFLFVFISLFFLLFSLLI